MATSVNDLLRCAPTWPESIDAFKQRMLDVALNGLDITRHELPTLDGLRLNGNEGRTLPAYSPSICHWHGYNIVDSLKPYLTEPERVALALLGYQV